MRKITSILIFSTFLSPTLTLGKETTDPICDETENWATQLTTSFMVEKGILKDSSDIFDNGKGIKTKTLDSVKLGTFSIPDYPKGTLYRQVLKISLQNKQGTPFELITISEASDIECSMSTPAVILISPEFKVLSEGKPYSGKITN